MGYFKIYKTITKPGRIEIDTGVHLLIGLAINADAQYVAILAGYSGSELNRRKIAEIMTSSHISVKLGYSTTEPYIDVAFDSYLTNPVFIVYQLYH